MFLAPSNYVHPGMERQMMEGPEMIMQSKLRPIIPQDNWNIPTNELMNSKSPEDLKSMNGFHPQPQAYPTYYHQKFDGRIQNHVQEYPAQYQSSSGYTNGGVDFNGYARKSNEYSRDNLNPEVNNENDSKRLNYESPQNNQSAYENSCSGLQASYDEHVLTKSEYLAQKRGKYNKSDFPNKPPRIFYYNGAEYYFNTYTGKDKQFMNYRCRDYNWNGSLKFHLKDSRMSPKILKDHYQLWKELKKPRTFSSTESQRKFEVVIDSELEQAKDSIESAHNIYERLARKAREFSAIERKHIYPPDKKQFMKKVRLIRKSLNPKTADDKFVFAEETSKSISGEAFVRFSTLFADSRGQKQHSIFWASSFQINLMRNWKQLFIDSTYQSVPRYFYQLLTISGLCPESNTVYQWGYWLMTSRSRDSYNQLFNYLKINFSIYPHVWIVDLDSNLKESLNSVYPNAASMICFYSLKRSLYLRLKTMGVMSSESTSDKIPSILDGISENLFRSSESKDALLLNIDQMHREVGPDFDEFFESFKTFVAHNHSSLLYSSLKIISNPLTDPFSSKLIQKCGPRPRLVTFIQALKDEENLSKISYPSGSSPEPPSTFSQLSETCLKPKRKIFLISSDWSDDEIEERYFSDKSSDCESDDFNDTRRNIELLKKVKNERLRRMERLECPNPKKYKTEEEYEKAVKDWKETSFKESYYDEDGNVYVRKNKNYSIRDKRVKEEYGSSMARIKYEEGENVYMDDDCDDRGDEKIFDVRHLPKKPDPLQKFKERLQKKEQLRAGATETSSNIDGAKSSICDEKNADYKLKLKSKKTSGVSAPKGSLMKSIMMKRDDKQNKSESKVEEQDNVENEKENKKEEDREWETETKAKEKNKAEKTHSKKFKFGVKDKNPDKIETRTQGRSGEAREESKAKKKEESSSSEEENNKEENSDDSSVSDNKKKSERSKLKKNKRKESDSEEDEDEQKKQNKKRDDSRSRSKSSTSKNDKSKIKKDSQAVSSSSSRNLRSKKRDESAERDQEEKIKDNEMTRKLRKRKPIKFGENSD